MRWQNVTKVKSMGAFVPNDADTCSQLSEIHGAGFTGVKMRITTNTLQQKYSFI